MPMNLTLASPTPTDYVNQIIENTEGLINGGSPTTSALTPPAPATTHPPSSVLSNPLVWVVGIAVVVVGVVLVSKGGS